ncbi:MAG TPA: phosphohistidine phosphatase SixA [Herpetosiphonaceae bacterium]
MKIFFMRHGIAEPAHGSVKDHDRALTEEGRSQVSQIAQAMQRLSIKPDVILTSPLVRARQTAEIVAPALEAPLETANELQPGAILDDLQRLLRRYPQETVMLVGHEPDFSALAARLINADERGILLKKGGMIRIDIDGRPQAGRGRLVMSLTPKTMLLLANGAPAQLAPETPAANAEPMNGAPQE